jgi:hypothetical protein
MGIIMGNRFGDNGFFFKHLVFRVPLLIFHEPMKPIPKGLHVYKKNQIHHDVRPQRGRMFFFDFSPYLPDMVTKVQRTAYTYSSNQRKNKGAAHWNIFIHENEINGTKQRFYPAIKF